MNFSDLSALAVRYRFLLLLLLGAVLYVAFLGQRDLWYPDEPDIAEVARAMFVSGDWIHPRRMGEIWVDYPPMIYWVGAVSSHLFGEMSAFSLRLPNALAAIATVLMVAWFTGRWFDARIGLWAGFALLTFLQFAYEANSYRPDVYFTLTITAGLLLYAEGAGDRPRLYLRAAAFACFGLAMLAKGPLGLLLPGLVLVLWLGAQRKWLRIIELGPLALIGIAVYVPWFAATAEGMGWQNMLYEFYAQNFERFLTSEHRGHAQPWYYYLRNFWLDFTPWSWLFPAAVWWLVRSGRYRDPKIQLALWWFGAFFVFLTIAATKRQLYLLPAYPAVALLLAPWLASVGQATTNDMDTESPGERPVHIYSIALAVIYAAIGIAVFVFVAKLQSVIPKMDLDELELEVARTIPVPLIILGVVLVATGLWVGHAWRQRRARAAIVRIGVAHVALYVVIIAIVMPTLEPTKTYKPQSRWISETIGDDQPFGMVDPNGIARRGGFSYYTGAMVPLLEGPAEVDRFFAEYPDTIVLIREDRVAGIFAGRETEWNARVVREIRVGRHLYWVVRGPADDLRLQQIGN